MKTKNEKLDDLFEKWIAEVPEYRECFIKDGIINEEEYNRAKKKILFITKEPNDPTGSSWDFRELWRNNDFYYTFAYRVAEWSYGILKDFPPYDEIWPEHNNFDNMKKAIKQIAFMNIKKNGGKGTSNKIEMIKHLEANREYLLKQVDIIDPEVIILGLSWEELTDGLFGTKDWYKSGFSTFIRKYGRAKVIDFYHPSARMGAPASYCMLKTVMETDIYKEL